MFLARQKKKQNGLKIVLPQNFFSVKMVSGRRIIKHMDKIALVQKTKIAFLTKIDYHNEIINILAMEGSIILFDHVNNGKSTITGRLFGRKLRSF